ncbi:MAG: zinc ribbon domain-containing protein [Deltaproteobacteria bacterium]
MREQFTALESLQCLDLKLRDLQENIEKYPREIARFNEYLSRLKESIAKSKGELAASMLQKSQAELKLASSQEGIKKSEQKLFEIKTYREYEALQKEIVEIKKSNSQLEDVILEQLERAESLERGIKSEEATLAEKELEYGAIIAEYQKHSDVLKRDYELNRQEKVKLASNIRSDVLSIYERIRKKNGVALVRATRNQICTGCNMNIPSQLFNEILKLTAMIQCPSCHRILYCEETENGQQLSA